MLKFVIFSMVLAIALAKPDGSSEQGGLLGALTQALPLQGALPAWMNNKCFSSLLSAATAQFTLSNLLDLIGCLLDQVISIVEQLLGGDHASPQSTLLIKLLNNLRSLLMNSLQSVSTLSSNTGGGSNASGSKANTDKGVTNILSSITKALPGLQG